MLDGNHPARYVGIATLVDDTRGRARLREALEGVRDIERLAGRAAAGRATPRELGALRDSFLRLPDVLEGLRGLARRDGSAALVAAETAFDLLADLGQLLAGALEERPPATLAEGGVIRRGYDAELDESRNLRDGGKQYIAALQQRERERTGIPSLKVGYNKVFGYYLEVTHAHTSRVPADYERRQTLSGAERYVTPELKEYERRSSAAEERMGSREAELVRRAAGPGRAATSPASSARRSCWRGSTSGRRSPSGQCTGGYVRPRITDRRSR